MLKLLKKLWKYIVSFFVVMALASFAYAAAPVIVESLANATPGEGYQYVELQVRAQQVNPNSYIEWYAYNIGGYSTIDFYGVSVSSGNATTLSAVPVFGDKVAVTSSTTITSGTDLTDIQASNYRFRFYNNVDVTTNVTLNFLIAD